MNRKDKLLYLADRLDDLEKLGSNSPVDFDMSGWGIKHDCGTVVCAAGLASMDPKFNGLGLGYKMTSKDRIVPAYKGLVSWTAIKEFFELTIYQAASIFDPEHYRNPVTPTVVATRIRELVREL